MRFKSYSFMFIFIFSFVLFLCIALQAELVKNYDSQTDETIINTKPTQIMELNPWKQPRLSLTIRYPGQEKPSPADLAELEVKMSFISLSRERKFDDYNVIQFYVDGKLVFQKKYELDTNVRKKSVMETMTVLFSYSDYGELMTELGHPISICLSKKYGSICKQRIELHRIELEDIPWVRELLR